MIKRRINDNNIRYWNVNSSRNIRQISQKGGFPWLLTIQLEERDFAALKTTDDLLTLSLQYVQYFVEIISGMMVRSGLNRIQT